MNSNKIKKIAEKMIESADTFKCPNCGTKVLQTTGYCVKCKKKVSSKKIIADTVAIKKIDDLLKLHKLPELFTINGMLFRIAGGSAESLEVYIREGRKPYISFFTRERDLDKVIEACGDYGGRIYYKVDGLKLIPDSVKWGDR
jgi:hypothetical protein